MTDLVVSTSAKKAACLPCLSKDNDLNVSEVCYEVGFVSKSHFTRSFQKEFGFNPSDFVKNKNVPITTKVTTHYDESDHPVTDRD